VGEQIRVTISEASNFRRNAKPSLYSNMMSSHLRKSLLSLNLAYIVLEDEKHAGSDFLKLFTSLQPTNYTFTEIHRPSHLFISFSTRGGESHFS
jgi:hypothetical protein